MPDRRADRMREVTKAGVESIELPVDVQFHERSPTQTESARAPRMHDRFLKQRNAGQDRPCRSRGRPAGWGACPDYRPLMSLKPHPTAEPRGTRHLARAAPLSGGSMRTAPGGSRSSAPGPDARIPSRKGAPLPSGPLTARARATSSTCGVPQARRRSGRRAACCLSRGRCNQGSCRFAIREPSVSAHRQWAAPASGERRKGDAKLSRSDALLARRNHLPRSMDREFPRRPERQLMAWLRR